MNRLVRLLALAVTLSLFAVIGASADVTDTETFTISGLSGPLAGNTYTGSFSWDATVGPQLTAFSTDFPDGGATFADLSAAFAPYASSGGLELFYAPGPVGNTNAMAFFDGSDLFTYGTTTVVNSEFTDAGQGTVAYGPVTTTGAPEPGTLLLLATGLLGALGAARGKRASSRLAA